MKAKSTILITGCSSGFGKATADYFIAQGWNVAATMRTPKPELFNADDEVLVTAMDVTDPDSVSEAIKVTIARFGKIDVLVNNAGIGMFGPHEAVSDEVIRQVFETNTFAVMALNRTISPIMREQGSGIIINITSSVGIAPIPMVAAYVASKYAIEGFSEALSYELGNFGVRVKLVEPGLAPTTSFAQNAGERADTAIPPAYGEYAQRFMKFMQNYAFDYTTAQDVAEVVYLAATDGEPRLRYPAGGDSVKLAELRRSLPEAEFMQQVETLI